MNPQSKLNTVMLIDDDSILLKHHRRIIERSDMVGNALAFSGGEEALEFLQQPNQPPVDLILLDLNMPGMNGFEFIDEASEKLGESFNDTVVVMLSSSLTPQKIKEGERKGVIGSYINKPLTIDLFQDIIQSYNDAINNDT